MPAFEHQSPVNENSKPPDSIIRGTMNDISLWTFLRDGLEREKDFSTSLTGTLLFQINSYIVLCKTVAL